MAPKGYLDVHCHFFPDISDEVASQLVAQLRAAHFLVEKPSQLQWSAEGIIEYNEHAGVAMALLSYVARTHDGLREGNDYAHRIVQQYPNRFGHLLALPTDDTEACLREIQHGDEYDEPKPDGYAVNTQYNGVLLSDARLAPVFENLDARGAVVHVHPNAYLPGEYCKPSALIDVAFDTCRVATDMLYKGVFRKYPNIKFIFAHCGGALPALSGRLSLLGAESWVPNPEKLTKQEIEWQLSRLYVDTAATAKTGLEPAAKMVGWSHCVYGADCGVPCSTWDTMDENLRDVAAREADAGVEPGTVRDNTWKLFSAAAKRAERS
jgi:predicted TIM-barrel fold metal-dependent hydrolase